MKISRSTGYALLAVGYIAKNQAEKGIILSQDISKAYKIPLEYLLKILQQLVRANVLRSKRGPRGGFNLAKPAKKINMLQIIEAVDGPMVSQLELVEIAGRQKYCVKTQQVYQKAINEAKKVFERAKIGDMI